MLFKIRKNVFETNSSSMHSISVCNEEDMSKPYMPRHEDELLSVKELLLEDGRFDLTYLYDIYGYGNGPEILDTLPEKLGYAVAEYLYDTDIAGGKADKEIAFLLEAIGLTEVTGFKFAERELWFDTDRRKIPYIPEINSNASGVLRDFVHSLSKKYGISNTEALHLFLFDDRYNVILVNDTYTDEDIKAQFPSEKIIFS